MPTGGARPHHSDEKSARDRGESTQEGGIAPYRSTKIGTRDRARWRCSKVRKLSSVVTVIGIFPLLLREPRVDSDARRNKSRGTDFPPPCAQNVQRPGGQESPGRGTHGEADVGAEGREANRRGRRRKVGRNIQEIAVRRGGAGSCGRESEDQRGVRIIEFQVLDSHSRRKSC